MTLTDEQFLAETTFSGHEPYRHLINIEVSEALAKLKAKFPDEEVQIWVKAVPGARISFSCNVAAGQKDAQFSGDRATANEAVEHLFKVAGDRANRHKARIAELRRELAELEGG